MYRPQSPFNTVVELFNCTTTRVLGVTTKEFTKLDDIFCTFKTYGGTETTSKSPARSVIL